MKKTLDFRKAGQALAVAGMLMALGLLTACGSSGEADPAGLIQDSITISALTGTDVGDTGSTFKMDVTVVTTGDIPANQITYTWEQTAGPTVIEKVQADGEYRSTYTFKPIASGDVTIKVTARTDSGHTSSQAKTVSVSTPAA